MRSRRAVATGGAALVMALMLGLPSRTAAADGAVDYQLTVSGSVPSGEIHTLFFEDPAAHLGQTQFAICGGSAPACAATVYTGSMTQLPMGSSFTYRFERVGPDGTVTAYFQGTGVVGEVAEIRAEFGYGVELPDVAMAAPVSAPWVPLGLVALGLAISAAGAVRLRQAHPG